ncbi:branched-chain amino acid transport system II carrier protein [Loigolactobacillus backii]|uniref:branched-chain amino acid transport system II carrier protein n=1 Tax=Loigolactobacillus backii TaxID=375175 RepID=UPI0007F156AE|nr:branched-chain amino acid transport system II carrier protein [Loigolactobacillus backii]ANK60646.1 branched-chain amino acid ABC transporter [Loigolactobacillus backii]ANK65599.1 branched-chain amino acid ABC transporter [Loigolactobacillus backii]ANK68071.1 branched-chain amino acid ABC transporter [Loigolactobacillus backii]OLF69804.1 branched-chain amino acid ABC transporter [Loigolactobacillus backii]PIO82306.1 branched-chain amino acid transport system II carrier protein [Loigolactoba
MLNEERKLTKRDYVVVSSMLFALFFGAGNLIFPLHLGQLAGGHWVTAAVGFLVTGVLLPLLSVLAISITRSEGVYDIGRPLGTVFALVFMVLIHGTIGPLFGTPRTATVSYTVGLAPLVPAKFQTLGLLVFSAVFFGLALFFALEQNKIVSNVGKLLNPLFLLLLAFVFFLAFSNPMGHAATQHVTAAYTSGAFTNGFLQGYNTMDALAGLAFGVTVVTAVRSLGKKSPNGIALVTARAGVFSMGLEALIYIGLIFVGAMSLGKFKVSANGGVAFDQVVNHYLGVAGQAVLAALITVTCLTTAIGLVAAFAQDFHKHFPKVSYRAWLTFTTLASFLVANVGLNQIIAWSTPMLMFLYPLAMVLILLSVFSPLFKRDSVVYAFVVIFTCVPAVFDMVAAFPAIVSQSSFGKAMTSFQQGFFPLAKYGMDWLVPALVGAVLGLAVHAYKRYEARSSEHVTNVAQQNK